MLYATREGLGMPHVIGSPGLSSAPRGVSPGSDMLGNGGTLIGNARESARWSFRTSSPGHAKPRPAQLAHPLGDRSQHGHRSVAVGLV